MRRRRLLAGLATGGLTAGGLTAGGLAGCLSTPRVAAGQPRTVAVSSTQKPPDLPAEPAVSVANTASTTDDPLRLRVAWENTSTARIRLGEARKMTFSYTASDDGRLRLYPSTPPRGRDYPVVGNGCWKLRQNQTITVTGEYRYAHLSPGGSFGRSLDLYGSRALDTDECLPTGAFDFETRITLHAKGGEPVENGTRRWGFTVEIS